VLVPIAVVIGAGEGLFLPGSFSIIPSLLSGDDLQAGNALASSGTQLATLAGPAIGGALVILAGPSLAFGLDALSFVVSAVTLAALSGPAVGALRRASSTAPAAAAETGAAPTPTLLAMLRSERVLQIIVLVNIAANLGMGGMSEVALPALAHGPLQAGASGYGAVLAAFGGGALLGTIAAGQVGRLRRPVIVGSLAFLAEAACIAVAPYLGATFAVACAMAGTGVLNGFGNVLTITAFQRWAPPAALGRLAGLLTLTSFGVFPISVALAAVLVRHWGPAPFFLLAAASTAVAILAGLSQRAWRDFGANHQTTTPEPAHHLEGQPYEPAASQ
jgi:predicted MFS family arabinose efflux permease